MFKSRKTGKPMPIYLDKNIPMTKFEQFEDIKELGWVSFTICRFRGTNIGKQCYRCHGFGHA